MAGRTERLLFAALALGVFVHVLLRAALVPLVHDEATSFLAYAQTGEFLPFRAMWDANNHYLSSAFGILLYKFFGLHRLSLRAVSVLAFLPYAWAAWRIGRMLRSAMGRWVLWPALLCCPLVLDFFSLFRGYGPALAALLVALDGALRFIADGSRRSLLQALIAMAFANAFILAWLPLCAVMLALLLPRVLGDRRLLAIWGVLGALPFMLAAGLAVWMARLGLLYHGSTEGYFAVTVRSLVRYALGAEDPGWALLIALVAGLAVAMIGVRARRTGAWLSPGPLVAALLVCEMGLRIVLAEAFGINYAEDRAALHAQVLGILAIAFAAEGCRAARPAAWLFAIALLYLPLRMVLAANLSCTVLWPEQSTPERFIRTVHEKERALGRPAVVGAYRLQGLTWPLEQRMLGGEGDICALGFPHGLNDLRLVDERVMPGAAQGYRELDRDPATGLRLLERERPLRTEVLLDTAFALRMDGGLASSAFELPARLVREHDLFIEIAASMRSRNNPVSPRLSLEAVDSSGTRLFDDLVFLATRRDAWKGERWSTIRWVPQQASATKLRIGLWAGEPTWCEAFDGRVVLRAVKD